MDCKEFRNIVADLFDKDTDPQIVAKCEEHISQCAECREYYEDLLMTAELLRPKHSPVSKAEKIKPASTSLLYKVAASFIGIIMLSGIVLAAYHIFSPTKEQPAVMSAPDSAPDSLVTFEGLRLDSILTIVGTHYNKVVKFRNEEARELRMSTTWNRNQPLPEFLGILNEFDGLLLCTERDTIVVETVAVEEDEE